jgi:hypothetical protein
VSVVGTGVLVALALSGCGGTGSARISEVASGFYRAVAADDGVVACDLLAPQTLRELEESAQAPCRTAILEEDIPDAGEGVKLERYATRPRPGFRGDTAFLAEFEEGWRIVAVSCRPRADQPYDCGVEG